MRQVRSQVLAAALSALPLGAAAQALDVPIVMDCVATEAACYATSIVAGLDPNGDGFLAVRSGPGTAYRMIDRLYNGDVVVVIDVRGPWYGVSYGNGRRGWAHGNWMIDGAG